MAAAGCGYTRSPSAPAAPSDLPARSGPCPPAALAAQVAPLAQVGRRWAPGVAGWRAESAPRGASPARPAPPAWSCVDHQRATASPGQFCRAEQLRLLWEVDTRFTREFLRRHRLGGLQATGCGSCHPGGQQMPGFDVRGRGRVVQVDVEYVVVVGR